MAGPWLIVRDPLDSGHVRCFGYYDGNVRSYGKWRPLFTAVVSGFAYIGIIASSFAHIDRPQVSTAAYIDAQYSAIAYIGCPQVDNKLKLDMQRATGVSIFLTSRERGSS